MIGHRVCKPLTHAKFPLRFPQEQEPGIGGLGSSLKINCEFLALDGWQIKGEQRSFGHGGCGAAQIREALCLDTKLLRESRGLRYSRHTFPHTCCIIQARMPAKLASEA